MWFMFWPLALGIVGFFLASLILPWTYRGRIDRLENEVRQLKARLSPLPAPHAASAKETPRAGGTEAKKAPPAAAAKAPGFEQKGRIGFEQQFGVRLPVWIGGIALAFAGFFLVKYSIETGMLTEEVRTVLGGAFGLALLYAGHWVRCHPSLANSTRIAQALSGAGIADLYICLFAATSLYHLLPQFVGFAGMAAVTGTAVILSLRHGAPIALLGLLGGFLTPLLVGSSEPNAPLLFTYLYMVTAGLLAVVRRRNWWWLSIPTVLGAFLWVSVWMATRYTSADGIWLGLFLLAIGATVFLGSKQALEKTGALAEAPGLAKALNYLTFGGAALLMALVVSKSDFGMTEWGLFGLLASGSILLASADQRTYGFAPWVSLTGTLIMLAAWGDAGPETFAVTAAAFALLYGASGYLLLWRADRPVPWAGLLAASCTGHYLVAYHALHDTWGSPAWSALAIAFALLALHLTRETLQKFHGPEAERQRLLAVFVVMGTVFVSLGLTIELKREFLSVAFAAQVLALSWINTRLDVRALRALTALVAGVFGFLLLPQVLLLIQLAVYSLTETELHLQTGIPIVDWPLFQLGLPACMFLGASLYLRRQKDGLLPRALEMAAIGLAGVMGYYLTRHAFHVDKDVLFVKAGFIERGVITNILFLYGLACWRAGRRFARDAFLYGGTALIGIALFRIGYFDLLAYDPLWSHQSVGALPLLNGLLLPYGLPLLWLYAARRELQHRDHARWANGTAVLMLALTFAYVSFCVRQLYQGEFLDGATAGNGETYAYSVAWLLLGIGLLFLGTLRRDRLVRIASLLVMILTAGKVFLYDASELEGLYRVFSFFGLGISLLGLSWFYARYVFGDGKESRR